LQDAQREEGPTPHAAARCLRAAPSKAKCSIWQAVPFACGLTLQSRGRHPASRAPPLISNVRPTARPMKSSLVRASISAVEAWAFVNRSLSFIGFRMLARFCATSVRCRPCLFSTGVVRLWGQSNVWPRRPGSQNTQTPVRLLAGLTRMQMQSPNTLRANAVPSRFGAAACSPPCTLGQPACGFGVRSWPNPTLHRTASGSR